MNNLPQEIVEIIVSFLPDLGLAPFATLSIGWQRAVERRTFFRISIKSHGEDMEAFTRIFTLARRPYLRKLMFTVILPFNEAGADARDEQLAHCEAYTSHVRRLFQVLADGDSADENIRSSGSVALCMSCVTSAREWMSGRNRQGLDRRVGLIDGGPQLPMVKCVSRLIFRVEGAGRRVALRAAVDLVKWLPRLKRIEIVASVVELDLAFLNAAMWHRDDRHDLAAALAESGFLSDSHCGEVSLSLEGPGPYTPCMTVPWIFPNYMNSLSYDPLGAAVRTLSHNLVSLDISGMFDGSLFWPGRHELPAMPACPWPRLRHFHAALGLPTLTKAWYFTNRPGCDYRDMPCDDAMQPLFASWAMALESMPVVEQATIHFQVEVDIAQPGFESVMDVKKWQVGFHAPNTRPHPLHHRWVGNIAAADLENPRLVFQNVGGWRPWQSTMERLRAYAKDRFPHRETVELEVDRFDNVTKVPMM
ncbi:hypothetical protein F4677DRAFT_355152 [Hypoxylon crocopeplum]|nr:hypothetical protein F4677DRAFT_355152 [Hypoxylon crocopeplum]